MERVLYDECLLWPHASQGAGFLPVRLLHLTFLTVLRTLTGSLEEGPWDSGLVSEGGMEPGSAFSLPASGNGLRSMAEAVLGLGR